MGMPRVPGAQPATIPETGRAAETEGGVDIDASDRDVKTAGILRVVERERKEVLSGGRSLVVSCQAQIEEGALQQLFTVGGLDTP